MDQTIQFRLRGKYLNYRLLPAKPKKADTAKLWVIPKTANYRPPANHPWRQIANAEYLKKLTRTSKVGHF